MYLVGGERANQSAPGLLGKDRAKARGAESRSDIKTTTRARAKLCK